MKRVAVLRPLDQTEQKKEKLSLAVVFKFPLQLWLLCLVYSLNYSATLTLIGVGKPFLVNKYEVTILDASVQSSVFFLALMIFAPLFGILVNVTGYNLTWIVVSSLLAIANHSMFAFTYISPYIVLLAMGMSGALLLAALSTIVPETVSVNQLAAAFGLLQSMYSLGNCVFGIMGGFIVQELGYFVLELFNHYLSISIWKKTRFLKLNY
jgi:MFS family permease